MILTIGVIVPERPTINSFNKGSMFNRAVRGPKDDTDSDDE